MSRVEVKSKGGRPRSVFTEEVLRSIPLWVALEADVAEIAEALNTTPGCLRVVCHKEGIFLRPDGAGVRSGLGRERWRKLRAEAENRELSPTQLLVRVVAAVIDHDLFTAVLTDYNNDSTE